MHQLLFLFEPETAHRLAIFFLRYYGKLCHFLRLKTRTPLAHSICVAGIHFPNRLGLAAGFDKNGEAIDGLARLGFGFIEIGTITPRPQAGNPRKRLFRLKSHQAIVNRMGFNNVGVHQAIANIKASHYKGVLGINIGKNADMPLERAAQDYLYGFKHFYPYASYITVNISSPNTEGLRTLQSGDALRSLVVLLKEEQAYLSKIHHRHVPFFIKIAPDLSSDEINEIVQICVAEEVEGIIATNTTSSREGVQNHASAKEVGGLSGAPLRARSNRVLEQLCTALAGRIPVIASGGVMSVQDAREKLALGASLVQVYTGFVYGGPAWVKQFVKVASKSASF